MLVSCRKCHAALASAAVLFSLSLPCLASPVGLPAAVASAKTLRSPATPILLNTSAAVYGADLAPSFLQHPSPVLGRSASDRLSAFSFDDSSAWDTADPTEEVLDSRVLSHDLSSDVVLTSARSQGASADLTVDPLISPGANRGAAPADVAWSGEGAAAGGRLFLLGTATLGICMLAAAVGSHSRNEEKTPPAPVRKPVAGRAWVQRGTTFCMPQQDSLRPAETAPGPATSTLARTPTVPVTARPAAAIPARTSGIWADLYPVR